MLANGVEDPPPCDAQTTQQRQLPQPLAVRVISRRPNITGKESLPLLPWSYRFSRCTEIQREKGETQRHTEEETGY